MIFMAMIANDSYMIDTSSKPNHLGNLQTPVYRPEIDVIMLTYVDYHPDNDGDASHEDDSVSDVPCVVCVQFSHYLKKNDP